MIPCRRLCLLCGSWGDPAANLKRVEAAVSGADLIVFPRAFLTGYALDQAGPDAVAGVAMPADDDRIAMVAAAAGPRPAPSF